MNFKIIIQARMSSTRLPNKTLLPIEGKPMLWYLIYRVTKCISLKHIVIATSNEKSDDKITDFCKKNNISCFRGSINNVLERYYQAAIIYKPDIIIRLTADNPLIDGQLVKQGLTIFSRSNIDYLSTTLERTYPVGLDFEIFSFQALKKAYVHAITQYDHEHVTSYIYKTKPKQFRLRTFKHFNDKSFYRLTVDTIKDYGFVKYLIIHYQIHKKGAEDIIAILDKYSPHL